MKYKVTYHGLYEIVEGLAMADLVIYYKIRGKAEVEAEEYNTKISDIEQEFSKKFGRELQLENAYAIVSKKYEV